MFVGGDRLDEPRIPSLTRNDLPITKVVVACHCFAGLAPCGEAPLLILDRGMPRCRFGRMGIPISERLFDLVLCACDFHGGLVEHLSAKVASKAREYLVRSIATQGTVLLPMGQAFN